MSLIGPEAQRLAEKLTATLESITDGFYTLDREWRFTYLNREAERLLRRTRADLLGKNVWEEYKEAVGTVFYNEFHRAVRENRSFSFEEYYAPFQEWIEVRLYPSAEGLAVYIRYITEHKSVALELIRTNKTLQMLSTCNEAMFKAETEFELLDRICNIAIDVGEYQQTYVALLDEAESAHLSPAAHAGRDINAFLSEIGSFSTLVDKDSPEWRSANTGDIVVIEDFAQVPLETPTIALASRFGCRGVICLPLREKNRVLGVLALYSADAIVISTNEIQLLHKFANDLSYGIVSICAQEEQRRLQLAVMKVATAVSANSGAAFFQQLATNMGEALGADVACVARLLPGEPLKARTIMAVVDGQPIDNFEYQVAGTPCENLMEYVDCIVPNGVAQQFPRSLTLAAMGAKAYVGRRLDNSAGEPIGLLFVLLRHDLAQSDFIVSTLKIFAVRAAAELERQDAESRLRQQASLLDQATDAIVVRDINNHHIQFWNKGAERIYGWTAEEAVGRSIEELLHNDPTAFRESTRIVIENGTWTGEIVEHRKDGRSIVVEGNWSLVRDENGKPQSIFAIKSDITERKMAEREIQELAYYDPLTHLPNRRLLLNRLHQALAATGRSQHYGALLFIDLDNFKTLNDTLGHDKGDMLLQQVAIRLSACIRASDTVARFGGDEFVIMLTDLSEGANEALTQVKAVGEKILSSFAEPFDLDQSKYYSSPSIGAALFKHQLSTVEELLKHADLAMYDAKAAGRNTLRFYDPELQQIVASRATLEAELRQALQNQEFCLYYQPQIDRNGMPIGAEALVRWLHPKRGLLGPSDFIALAEQTKLIQPLGRWVLETACAELASWSRKPGMEGLSMAVNVCADEFQHAEFSACVMETIERTGVNPKLLELELTESVIVENVKETIAKMTTLKEAGVRFSLDDFGTGYSSLSYLKRMPLNQLKIDQSFVRDILTDTNDAVIARTIVALADSLGLTVIAEGVETEEQRSFLADNGCHAYQGYLFSHPLSAEQLEDFVTAKNRLISI